MFTTKNTVFHRILFVFIVFTAVSVLVTDHALASNKSEVGKYKLWHSGNGRMEVWVSIEKSDVNVTVWSDVPVMTLQKVNSHLWETYGKQYISINDFNRDGQLDIGVMEGAGLAGNDKCYAVYEYMPEQFSYRSKSSMTVCR